MSINIITGEKLQCICGIYIGKHSDLHWNPIISRQTSKHVNIDNLTTPINNPSIVFCYGHVMNEFSTKLHLLVNPFILITHNSDQNIKPIHEVMTILNHNKVVKWYGQNIDFHHDKLKLLPIGLANSMWPHGNLSIFDEPTFLQGISTKTRDVYFQFNINTNTEKRLPCYNILRTKYEWLSQVSPHDNLRRLKTYRFCICPEGNGIDTHRLWECLYLRVVPIMIRSVFTELLSKHNVPMVLLRDWSELHSMSLQYDNYNFDDDTFQNLILYPKLLHSMFAT